MDKHIPGLRGEVVGADTTRPAVARVGAIQLNLVSSSYCSKRDQVSFRRLGSTVVRAGVGHQREPWKGPQQHEERERWALTESIMQPWTTREVDAEPAAG